MKRRCILALMMVLVLCVSIFGPGLAMADTVTVDEGDYSYPAVDESSALPTATGTPDHVVTGTFTLDYDFKVEAIVPHESTMFYIRTWEEGAPEDEGVWHMIRGYRLST